MNKRRIIILASLCLLLALIITAGLLIKKPAVFRETPVTEANASNFAELLSDLVAACEATEDASAAEKIDLDLEAIRSIDATDYTIAKTIADHWCRVFLDPSYRLLLHSGEDSAKELAASGVPNSKRHAFVILGYQLMNGEMQPELIGRLDAAAVAAKAFPKTIIVCSGGATGPNNPEGHTEAGLMKDYLVEHCGIDANRIFIDENAMTTQENAENTLKILQSRKVRSMTIITSSYHQCWGQADYNAVAALFEQQYGYKVEIKGNYCFAIEPSVEVYKTGYRIAALQIAGILELPDDAMKLLPSMFPPVQEEQQGEEEPELAPAA